MFLQTCRNLQLRAAAIFGHGAHLERSFGSKWLGHGRSCRHVAKDIGSNSIL